MAIKVLIEDAELRGELAKELRATLTTLGREEAQKIFAEVVEVTVKKQAEELSVQSYFGSGIREKFVNELKKGMMPQLETLGCKLLMEKVDAMGGFSIVERMVRNEVQKALAEMKAQLQQSMGMLLMSGNLK